MSELKRYECRHEGFSYSAWHEECDNGEWVKASEADAQIASLTARIKELERSRDIMDYVQNFWQARFNVLSDAWRTGNNDAVLDAVRVFLKANDTAQAEEKLLVTAELEQRLAEAERDAKRYRFLCDNADLSLDGLVGQCYISLDRWKLMDTKEVTLDAAIDTAIGESHDSTKA